MDHICSVHAPVVLKEWWCRPQKYTIHTPYYRGHTKLKLPTNRSLAYTSSRSFRGFGGFGVTSFWPDCSLYKRQTPIIVWFPCTPRSPIPNRQLQWVQAGFSVTWLKFCLGLGLSEEVLPAKIICMHFEVISLTLPQWIFRLSLISINKQRTRDLQVNV